MNKVANRGVQKKRDDYLLDPVNPVPRKKYLKYCIINGVRYYKTEYDGYYISKSANILTFRQNKVNFLGLRPVSGHYTVSYLYQDGIRFKVPVHQLMMQTFYGNAPNGYVVDHINFEKSDNRLENLRYISNKDNIRRSCCDTLPPCTKSVIAIINGTRYEFESITEFGNISKFSGRALKLLRKGKDPGCKRSKHIVKAFKMTDKSMYIEIYDNPTYTRVDNLSDL